MTCFDVQSKAFSSCSHCKCGLCGELQQRLLPFVLLNPQDISLIQVKKDDAEHADLDEKVLPPLPQLKKKDLEDKTPPPPVKIIVEKGNDFGECAILGFPKSEESNP